MKQQLKESLEAYMNLYTDSGNSAEREMCHLLQSCMNRIGEQDEQIQALQSRIEQVERKLKNTTDDFMDYATQGNDNFAPFCANKSDNCIDKRGWCIDGRCKGRRYERTEGEQ